MSGNALLMAISLGVELNQFLSFFFSANYIISVLSRLVLNGVVMHLTVQRIKEGSSSTKFGIIAVIIL